MFKNRYILFTGGQIWDDSSICGTKYSANVIGKSKKFNLTAVQKTSVLNGDSNEWDLTTLTALLLNTDRPETLDTAHVQQFENEDQLLIQLRDIRNTLAHHKSKSIVDNEFHQFWSKLSTILVAFGDVKSEIDKLKNDSVFEISTQSLNDENTKEAICLNSLGAQAHKGQQYSDAITLFTKAVVLIGVPHHNRAVFYSNMSSSRLALYEQEHQGILCTLNIDHPRDQRYRALQDAKQARNLLPTWWKGHFRVGKVYAVLDEHEKAINSFGRALALDPTHVEVQKAMDERQEIHGRQQRQEHLDPRLKPRTMDELLKEMNQKLGTDPQKVRLSHSILEKTDPAGADVVKGHKYSHGDIDIKQDYEQAARYFAKAASQGNAEGMYNLARLTDLGLGVKKDHRMALSLLEQAAAQPPKHSIIKNFPNIGVAEAEHALGLRYAEGVVVHKNWSIAAQWYQRAINHGSAESANNLALMYQNGTGVDRDIDKAEQLLELSARRGDPNAMLTLADLLCDKNNLEMAQNWYDRACESGNIVAQTNHEKFKAHLLLKQQFMSGNSSPLSQGFNKLKQLFDSYITKETTNEVSNRLYVYDFNVLNEYAINGSITAKKLCNAIEYFKRALNILKQSEALTEQEENNFVHELSQCYRIERTVAQIPSVEMHRKIEDILNRVLYRCNSESNITDLQLEEDIRTCYATLHMDSHKLIVQFLGPCKEKYPRSIYFFQLNAILNNCLGQYEDSLYDVHAGLEVNPKCNELLYQKAILLKLLNRNVDERIEAYQTFLSVAPEDHPKVPESYYAIASCYYEHEKRDLSEKIYKQGKEAEKIQLPCFLPYESTNKTRLKHIIDKECLSTTEVARDINRKLRLTNPHRIEVFKTHREWEAHVLEMKDDPKTKLQLNTAEPRVKQSTAKSLIGLKSISLKEMNPTKDHVYDGYVLSVTIIEKAYSWNPSIHLVIEDENLDCERMFIYGFAQRRGESLINKVFTIGSKMNIINPYLRLGKNDMKSLIRVDDFSSIIMQNESDKVINMCRCCGEPNAPHVCSKCKQARYCSKECQAMDWKLYQHKLICKR